MKAVIMAGGEGTRLRPLTSTRPKPMVPIVNQPVMEHILGLVKHHGMTEVVATLAFMPRVIQEYFGDGEEWGMSISYAIEETPLGTAGSVKNAESLLNDGPFIVISGDAVTDFDLREAARFHASHDGPVTIVLTRVPEVSDNLADQIARIVRSIRQLDLKKAPSVSETIDWARTLVLLGIESIDAQQAKETLHILLKYQTDIAKAAKELSIEK